MVERARLLAGAHASYLVATGVWPIVHRRSFERSPGRSRITGWCGRSVASPRRPASHLGSRFFAGAVRRRPSRSPSRQDSCSALRISGRREPSHGSISVTSVCNSSSLRSGFVTGRLSVTRSEPGAANPRLHLACSGLASSTGASVRARIDDRAQDPGGRERAAFSPTSRSQHSGQKMCGF